MPRAHCGLDKEAKRRNRNRMRNIKRRISLILSQLNRSLFVSRRKKKEEKYTLRNRIRWRRWIMSGTREIGIRYKKLGARKVILK